MSLEIKIPTLKHKRIRSKTILAVRYFMYNSRIGANCSLIVVLHNTLAIRCHPDILLVEIFRQC